MTNRDDDTTSVPGPTWAGRAKRVRIARMGGEASGKNEDRGSSRGQGGSSGSEREGSSGGGRGGSKGSSESSTYDPGADRCRDESGRLSVCDDDKSSGQGPNRQRTASRGGEQPRSGRGRTRWLPRFRRHRKAATVPPVRDPQRFSFPFAQKRTTPHARS